MFDESFNRTTQTCQMDLQTRFWDSIQNQAVARYLTSEYLGHTAVGDLFPRLMNTIFELNECVLVQIGMDGPSTNLALYNRIKADRLVKDLNVLIDPGSCSLHVIHGALGTGTRCWQKLVENQRQHKVNPLHVS